MSENTSIIDKLANAAIAFIEPENFQKYVLGTTKKGRQRSLYDVYLKRTKLAKADGTPKKKKKKHAKKKKHYRFNGYYAF